MAKSHKRVELKGSMRAALRNAKDVGPADPNQEIQLSVYLRRSEDLAKAEEIGTTPISSRNYLSREDFARAHGAQADDLEKIRAFAAEYGLRVVNEDLARRLVQLSGTVEALNKAF